MSGVQVRTMPMMQPLSQRMASLTVGEDKVDLVQWGSVLM